MWTQVEFMLQPAGNSLPARNTAGGLINITSRRPSDVTTGWIEGQYGNYNFRDVRGGLSGPIVDGRSGFSMAAGFSARDGYTKNDATGHDVDSRSAGFGKGQLLFTAERQTSRLRPPVLSGRNLADRQRLCLGGGFGLYPRPSAPCE